MKLPQACKRRETAKVSVKRFLVSKTLLVAVLLTLSSFLGVVRESVIAHQFGATGTTDAFLIAMIIPTNIYLFGKRFVNQYFYNSLW